MRFDSVRQVVNIFQQTSAELLPLNSGLGFEDYECCVFLRGREQPYTFSRIGLLRIDTDYPLFEGHYEESVDVLGEQRTKHVRVLVDVEDILVIQFEDFTTYNDPGDEDDDEDDDE